MRKLRVLLSLLLAFVLAACSSSGSTSSSSSSALDLSTIKTVEDAYKIAEDKQYIMEYNKKHFVLAFDYDGAPIRVIADMTEDVYNKMEELSGDVETMDERDKAAYGLAVTKAEDLTSEIPSQEELDKLIGKTGKELIDDGYLVTQSNIEGDNAVYVLMKDMFSYEFTFNEKVEYEEDLDYDKVLETLTVKSVKYYGLGDNITSID